MTRTERLLHLMQHLRSRKRPVQARQLAEALGISLRTVYRDIDTLRRQGADIRGEAGIGYILHRDNTLPPLTFSPEEIEALAFGMRAAIALAEDGMAQHAESVIAKIRAVLPAPLLKKLQAQSLFPLPQRFYAPDEQDNLALIRRALRGERKLTFAYQDVHGQHTRRTVWPLAIGYFEQTRLLAAWCELRGAFRHFRTDRITAPTLGDAIPVPHRHLFNQWQQQQNIRPDANRLCPANTPDKN